MIKGSINADVAGLPFQNTCAIGPGDMRAKDAVVRTNITIGLDGALARKRSLGLSKSRAEDRLHGGTQETVIGTEAPSLQVKDGELNNCCALFFSDTTTMTFS